MCAIVSLDKGVGHAILRLDAVLSKDIRYQQSQRAGSILDVISITSPTHPWVCNDAIKISVVKWSFGKISVTVLHSQIGFKTCLFTILAIPWVIDLWFLCMF